MILLIGEDFSVIAVEVKHHHERHFRHLRPMNAAHGSQNGVSPKPFPVGGAIDAGAQSLNPLDVFVFLEHLFVKHQAKGDDDIARLDAIAQIVPGKSVGKSDIGKHRLQ